MPPSGLSVAFKARLCNFRATGVNTSPKAAPPFCLRGNFDGRAFNSEYFHSATMAPMWALDTSFEYHSPSIEALAGKFLVVECYGGDVFLGMCRIDLLTLARGPSSLELQLREGHRPTGMLTFDVMFQQVCNVTLQFCRLSLRRLAGRGYEGGPNPYLSYGFVDSGHQLESPVAPNAESPEWERLPPLHLKCSFAQLCEQRIRFDVKSSRNGFTAGINDPTMATFEISLSTIPIDIGRDCAAGFREMVHSLPSYPYPFSTECSGMLEFRNVQKVVQMRGGVQTDDGVVGGVPAGNAPEFSSSSPARAALRPAVADAGTALVSPPRRREAPVGLNASVLPPIEPPVSYASAAPWPQSSQLPPPVTSTLPLTTMRGQDIELLEEVTEKHQTLLSKAQARLTDVSRRRADVAHQLSSYKAREDEVLETSARRRAAIEADTKAAIAERERLEAQLSAIAARREEELRVAAALQAERERARRALEEEQREVAVLEQRVSQLRAEMARHLEEEEARYAQRIREAEEARRRSQIDEENLAALEARLNQAEARATQRQREEASSYGVGVSPGRRRH